MGTVAGNLKAAKDEMDKVKKTAMTIMLID